MDTSGSQSGALSSQFAYITEGAYPITLSRPDPLTNPLLGDGSNQSVYDSQTPDGELDIPGSIKVAGAGSDDTNWLINNNHVDLAIVNSTIPNALTHGWVVGNDIISVNVPGSTYPGANWVFIGLPASNSGFGNHLATLYVDGAASQTAHIQTFFTGSIQNHPNPDNTPNWFYYYNQVYPPTGSDTRTYEPGNRSHSDNLNVTQFFTSHREALVYIDDDAYQPFSIPVFGVDRSCATPFLVYLGTLYTKGIHTFVAVCAHEQGHATAWMTPGIEDASTDPYTASSNDKDIIVDSWEDNHHMNHHSPDTTGAFGAINPATGHIINPTTNQDDMDVPDNEVLACIPSLGAVLNNAALWTQDWADTGLQKGAPRFYDIRVDTGQPEGFYWTFTANPNHLPTGTGVYGNGMGNYHITSLQDLQTLYPGMTIATSWDDIAGMCPPQL